MDNQPPTPPLWAVVIASAVMGVIAQLGASLALDMARDRSKLYGFLLLSLVFSGGAPVLLIKLAYMDSYVASTIGALIGAVPALWTLRAGVKGIGQKYGVEIGEISAAPPEHAPVRKEEDHDR